MLDTFNSCLVISGLLWNMLHLSCKAVDMEMQSTIRGVQISWGLVSDLQDCRETKCCHLDSFGSFGLGHSHSFAKLSFIVTSFVVIKDAREEIFSAILKKICQFNESLPHNMNLVVWNI